MSKRKQKHIAPISQRFSTLLDCVVRRSPLHKIRSILYKNKVDKNIEAQNHLKLRIMRGLNFIKTLDFLYPSYNTAFRCNFA